MCDVPSIAVFCKESIECVPGIIIIIIIIIISTIRIQAQLCSISAPGVTYHSPVIHQLLLTSLKLTGIFAP